MLDLRLVRNFVAVAETEHVGRAAKQLNISQSPLSRQIRQLEDELGLRLFERAGRRVHLTDAGRWLLLQSRDLLARAGRLERDAARVAHGEVGRVSIGFVHSALWTRLLPVALRRFARSHPDVEVELHNLSSSVQRAALRRGDIDLGLVHAAPAGEDAGTKLLEERFLLAIPEDNDLARQTRIAPSRLDGQAWITLARSVNAQAYDRHLAACGRAGFVPNVRAQVGDWSTALALVEAGVGLSLVPASTRPLVATGVQFRSAPWFPVRMRLEMVVPAGGTSTAAAALADTLVATARERAAATGPDSPRRAGSRADHVTAATTQRRARTR